MSDRSARVAWAASVRPGGLAPLALLVVLARASDLETYTVETTWKDLATEIGVTPAAISRAADQLQAADLISARYLPHDLQPGHRGPRRYRILVNFPGAPHMQPEHRIRAEHEHRARHTSLRTWLNGVESHADDGNRCHPRPMTVHVGLRVVTGGAAPTHDQSMTG